MSASLGVRRADERRPGGDESARAGSAEGDGAGAGGEADAGNQGNQARFCSVEKLSGSGDAKDHEVVGQEPEAGFAALAGDGPGPQCGPETAFDHREDGLDLPALAVELSREPSGESSPPIAAQPTRSAIATPAAATVQGKDAADPQTLAAKAVAGFAVEAGIPQERGKGLAGVGLPDGGLELAVVRLGAPVDDQPEHEVTEGVADGGNLGITGFFVGPVPGTTAGEVVRDMSGFQAGRVDGGQATGGRDQADAAGLGQDFFDEPREGVFFRSRRSA